MVNKHYQKHKERLRKEAHERYENLSKEEKIKGEKKLEKDIKISLKKKKKRCQYYQEPKQKLPEYRKNYYLTHKKKLLVHFKDPSAVKFISWISP